MYQREGRRERKIERKERKRQNPKRKPERKKKEGRKREKEAGVIEELSYWETSEGKKEIKRRVNRRE